MRTSVISLLLLITPLLLSAQIKTDSLELWDNDRPETIQDTRIFGSYLLSIGSDSFIEYIKADKSNKTMANVRVAKENILLRSISKSGNDHAYICGDRGNIFKLNSISDIERIDIDIKNDLNDIEICGDFIFFSDFENNIYKTKDFISIEKTELDEVVNDILYTSNKIYLACDNGIAYISHDLGSSWKKQQLEESSRDLLHVSADFENNIYFSGTSVIKSDTELDSYSKFAIDLAQYPNIQRTSELYWIGKDSVVFNIYPSLSTFFSLYIPSKDSLITVLRKDGPTPLLLSCDSHGNGFLAREASARIFNREYIITSTIGVEEVAFNNVPQNSDICLLYTNEKYSVVSLADSLNNYYILKFDANAQADTIIKIDNKYNDGFKPDAPRNSKNTFVFNDSTYCIFIDSIGTDDKTDYSKATRLFSKDNGKNWEISINPFGFYNFNLYNNIISGIISDTSYSVSYNGGESWTEIREPKEFEGSTFNIVCLNNNSILTLSYPDTKYYISRDAGQTWENISHEHLYMGTFKNSIYIDADLIFYQYINSLLHESALYKTDSEVSKFELQENIHQILLYGKRINPNTGYLVGLTNIYITNDNFQSFDSVKYNNDFIFSYPDFANTHFVDNKDIYNILLDNKLYSLKLDQLLSVAYSKEADYKELVAFPNPATDYIELKRKDISLNMGMIVDYTGKERKIITDINNGIDLKDLESGTYFLILIDDDGNPYRTKFVVAK